MEARDSAVTRVRGIDWLAFIAGSLLALPFVLTLGLGRSFSYDEQQHIAAGVLFARDGLLPYRDFAYFHLPYLVYAYGFIFSFTDQYLLGSRWFSIACAALTCGAVFHATWTSFARTPWGRRLAIAIGALLLLISAPLFSHTVGHSWNQEPSVLLALLAFLSLRAGLAEKGSSWWLLASGLLTGLAVGIRITMAPLVAPFALMIWLRFQGRERWKPLLVFAAGTGFALLPVLWVAISAPTGFIFGNVEFPKLNVEYRMASGEPRTMTVPKKLRFLFKEISRPNWVLFYGFVAAWLAASIRLKRPAGFGQTGLLGVVLTLAFLLVGALAPSPSFDQYYYPFAPFLVLGIVFLLASIPAGAPRLKWIWPAAGAAVLFAFALGAREYEDMRDLLRPSEWNPNSERSDAMRLRSAGIKGLVLTTAPALPLEAGLSIYPEFVTGPFAWRVAPFVQKERRAALHIVGSDDLEARLSENPPGAVLLGYNPRWEEPLEQYAKAHGYRRQELLDEKELWLPPAAASAK